MNEKKIVANKDYVAGWLDCSIHDLLQALDPGLGDVRYTLITTLDSDPNPASLLKKSPELKPLAAKATLIGKGILLPLKVLQGRDAVRCIFFGFDEVWFFSDTTIAPKPSSLSIVGPARLNQARFDKVGKWMSTNGCSLGLGGGDGLNFVVGANSPVMKTLLGYTIEQPSPALAGE